MSVCLSVCLSASIYLEPHARSYQIFCACCPIASSGGVTQYQGEGTIVRVFFPINNTLYSITFGTHMKTAEPIEMPFGSMTRVGPKYHVLDGGPDHPSGREIFWGKVAAHCKVIGHFTVRCEKSDWTAPHAVLDEDSDGPTEPCIRWGHRSHNGGGAIYEGCLGHSKT